MGWGRSMASFASGSRCCLRVGRAQAVRVRATHLLRFAVSPARGEREERREFGSIFGGTVGEWVICHCKKNASMQIVGRSAAF